MSDKPYDDLAISRAIASVSDPALQSFLEAVADVVTGISGSQQLRNVEQREALTRDIAEERRQVYEALRDVRYQYKQLNDARVADANDRQQIAGFLDHQGKQIDKLAEMPERVEAVKEGLSLFAAEFSQTSEALTQWRDSMDEWRKEVDRELESFRQSRDESIAERQQLQQQWRESRDDRKLIHQELLEAKRERADMAAQLERLSQQYDELASGINGRLTQLLTASSALARTEGRDEERAHPGDGNR